MRTPGPARTNPRGTRSRTNCASSGTGSATRAPSRSPGSNPATLPNDKQAVRHRPARRRYRTKAEAPSMSAPTHPAAAGRPPLVSAVNDALATVIDPELRRPITELGMVDSVQVSDDGKVTVAVLLTIAGCPLRDTITADSQKALSAVPGVTAVDIELKVMDQAQRDALKEKLRGPGGQRTIPFNEPDSLTKVYAVASGKGGVGKSSVTVNLATALAARGL